MGLTLYNGKLLLRDGKLGTGQGCCCGGGACCLPDGTCTSGGTQEECEACETVNTCTEYLFLEDPDQPCPEGWQGGGGFCQRTTNPASCEECAGDCWPQQQGPCGIWIPDSSRCEIQPLCEGQQFLYVCGFPASIDTPGAGSCCGIPDGTRIYFAHFGNPIELIKDPFTNTYSNSNPAAIGSLSVKCGRWRFSWSDSSGNLCAFFNATVDIDMGEVSDNDCLPPGGSGTLYWTSLNCNTLQPISGSVAITLSVSTSSSC